MNRRTAILAKAGRESESINTGNMRRQVSLARVAGLRAVLLVVLSLRSSRGLSLSLSLSVHLLLLLLGVGWRHLVGIRVGVRVHPGSRSRSCSCLHFRLLVRVRGRHRRRLAIHCTRDTPRGGHHRRVNGRRVGSGDSGIGLEIRVTQCISR